MPKNNIREKYELRKSFSKGKKRKYSFVKNFISGVTFGPVKSFNQGLFGFSLIIHDFYRSYINLLISVHQLTFFSFIIAFLRELSLAFFHCKIRSFKIHFNKFWDVKDAKSRYSVIWSGLSDETEKLSRVQSKFTPWIIWIWYCLQKRDRFCKIIFSNLTYDLILMKDAILSIFASPRM